MIGFGVASGTVRLYERRVVPTTDPRVYEQWVWGQGRSVMNGLGSTALFVLASFGIGVAIGLFLLGLAIGAAVALAVALLLFVARGERWSSSWR